ncbi:MAG: hypothetical protein LUC50_02395 [Ruminococcus sp.]|nr:hypothetical protein [Ruminococcus sp.]
MLDDLRFAQEGKVKLDPNDVVMVGDRLSDTETDEAAISAAIEEIQAEPESQPEPQPAQPSQPDNNSAKDA